MALPTGLWEQDGFGEDRVCASLCVAGAVADEVMTGERGGGCPPCLPFTEPFGVVSSAAATPGPEPWVAGLWAPDRGAGSDRAWSFPRPPSIALQRLALNYSSRSVEG